MKTERTHHFQRLHPKHLKRVRELSEEKGQRWVAEQVGLAPSAISRLLSGDFGVRPSTLASLSAFCEKHGAPKNSNGGDGADALAEAVPLIEAFAKIPAARRASALEALMKFI